jgi:hypothetical protein
LTKHAIGVSDLQVVITVSDLELWEAAAKEIFWYQAPSVVLDDSEPPFYRWYPDGVTNVCYNALDIHVQEGRGEQLAVIYDSPVTDSKTTLTYAELLDRVARLAGVLSAEGIEKGDRVLVYMPMVPEALIAMLACARLGAIHSVVFGGFASHELAVRIDDATPKIVLSASCGVEPTRIVPYKPLLDQAIEMAEHKPDRCIILQRPQQLADLAYYLAAAAAARRPGLRARSRLARGGAKCRSGGLCAGRGERSTVHPVYLGHDRQAERGSAGYRGQHRRIEMEHVPDIRR